MEDRDGLQALEQQLRDRGIEAAALVPDSQGTLAPPGLTEAEDPTLSDLPVLSPNLTLGAVIAQGGMGVIRRAVQLPLHREVAVKSVHKGSRRERSAAALLREARVTGLLEHPNIIPIHTLGKDADGDPIFLMRRIEGVPWSTLIREPDHPSRAKDDRDALELHLEVLSQVCNAVHFAHSRGIIHRDLKPSNVMVGEFGEVYVLDWGIAVTTREALTGILRHASEATEVAGTPQYMAPELAIGDAESLGARTDVYLLGAMLHHCLTGKPPHTGKTVMATLLSAYRSKPHDYGEGVPPELAAICHKAMHADPQQRFASADELRRTLRAFRDHRQSASLSRETTVRLDALRALVAVHRARRTVDPTKVHNLFSECRFGFQQALRTWPDNTAAREGLTCALELMAGYHLDQEDHRAASLLVGEMGAPPAELVSRLEALQVKALAQQEEVEQLKQIKREMDLDVGQKTRSIIVLIFSLVYFCLPVLAGTADRRGWLEADLLVVTVIALSFVVISVVGIRLGARVLFRTEVNRRIVRSMRVLSAVMIALPLGCLWLGLDGPTLQTILLLVYALFIGGLAATVDTRIVWAAGIYLTGFLGAAAFRWAVFEITGVATLLATAFIAYTWRPRRAARS